MVLNYTLVGAGAPAIIYYARYFGRYFLQDFAILFPIDDVSRHSLKKERYIVYIYYKTSK